MVKAIIYLLFSFRGRISRKQWWFGFVVWWLFSLCIGTMVELIDSIATNGLGAIPAWIVILWSVFALHTKRHHDRNRPGWWTIIAIISAMATWIMLAIIPGLRGIILILWIVFFGCLRGDVGENRYGPTPKPLFKNVLGYDV